MGGTAAESVPPCAPGRAPCVAWHLRRAPLPRSPSLRTSRAAAGSRGTTDELAPEARAAAARGAAPAPFDHLGGAAEGGMDAEMFDAGFGANGLDDELLPPPMGDDDEAAAAALAAEARRASGLFGAAGEAGGAYDALPPTPAREDGGAGEAADAAAAERRAAAAAAARRDRGAAAGGAGAKARAVSRARGAAVAVDVRDGRAATQLDAGGIRALLADRRPLLREVRARRCVFAAGSVGLWRGGCGLRGRSAAARALGRWGAFSHKFSSPLTRRPKPVAPPLRSAASARAAPAAPATCISSSRGRRPRPTTRPPSATPAPPQSTTAAPRLACRAWASACRGCRSLQSATALPRPPRCRGSCGRSPPRPPARPRPARRAAARRRARPRAARARVRGGARQFPALSRPRPARFPH